MYRKGDGVKQSDTLFEKFARLAETLNSQTARCPPILIRRFRMPENDVVFFI